MEDTTARRECSTCGQPVYQVVTPAGTRVEIDVEPTPDGVMHLLGDDLDGRMHAVAMAAGDRPVLYRVHAVACPDTHHHRRTRP